MNDKLRQMVIQSGLPRWCTEDNHNVQIASKLERLYELIIEDYRKGGMGIPAPEKKFENQKD